MLEDFKMCIIGTYVMRRACRVFLTAFNNIEYDSLCSFVTRVYSFRVESF